MLLEIDDFNEVTLICRHVSMYLTVFIRKFKNLVYIDSGANDSN